MTAPHVPAPRPPPAAAAAAAHSPPADSSEPPLSSTELASELQRFDGYRAGIAGDIERLEQRRARLAEDVEQYDTLVRNAQQLLAEGTASLGQRVDLGAGVSCAARVPDTSRMYVAVGLGFHVEATLAEVAELVAPRREHVASQLEQVQQRLTDAIACKSAFDNSLQLLRMDQQAAGAAGGG